MSQQIPVYFTGANQLNFELPPWSSASMYLLSTLLVEATTKITKANGDKPEATKVRKNDIYIKQITYIMANSSNNKTIYFYSLGSDSSEQCAPQLI